MKTPIKISVVAILVILTIFTSCDSNDDDKVNDVFLTNVEIPSEIKTYISIHFPANTIIRAEKETEFNEINYDIYLSESFNLEFNSEFDIIEIDGIIELPDSVIPQPILDYIAQNYTNNFITDWELEYNHQQVELNNNVELEFEINGVFIRIDKD